MVVVVDKGRTMETRQDVSFIRQPPPDKEAALDTFNLFLLIIAVIIIITRSYAALRAADLDWIVGPGYSPGG